MKILHSTLENDFDIHMVLSHRGIKSTWDFNNCTDSSDMLSSFKSIYGGVSTEFQRFCWTHKLTKLAWLTRQLSLKGDDALWCVAQYGSPKKFLCFKTKSLYL